jgi:hypothetical protein
LLCILLLDKFTAVSREGVRRSLYDDTSTYALCMIHMHLISIGNKINRKNTYSKPHYYTYTNNTLCFNKKVVLHNICLILHAMHRTTRVVSIKRQRWKYNNGCVDKYEKTCVYYSYTSSFHLHVLFYLVEVWADKKINRYYCERFDSTNV